jgi:transcriptional regulator with XRE-family HTH domain
MPKVNGDAMRLARLRKGWSKKRLAQECLKHGIPVRPDALSRIELGRNGTDPDRLLVIAQSLDCTVDHLLGLRELPEAEMPARLKPPRARKAA